MEIWVQLAPPSVAKLKGQTYAFLKTLAEMHPSISLAGELGLSPALSGADKKRKDETAEKKKSQRLIPGRLNN